jgi:hypothetical protein
MGEGKKDALGVNFDKKSKLEFHRVKVTSDAGLLSVTFEGMRLSPILIFTACLKPKGIAMQTGYGMEFALSNFVK